MSFSITFDENNILQENSKMREDSTLGSITIDDFSEGFISPLVDWSRDDYRSHWKSAIHSILTGLNSSTILLTTYYKPENANFYEIWALFQEKEIVFVQNKLLFMSELGEIFTFSNLSKYAGDRRTEDEDGNKISEWETTLIDLEKFSTELDKLV